MAQIIEDCAVQLSQAATQIDELFPDDFDPAIQRDLRQMAQQIRTAEATGQSPFAEPPEVRFVAWLERNKWGDREDGCPMDCPLMTTGKPCHISLVCSAWVAQDFWQRWREAQR